MTESGNLAKAHELTELGRADEAEACYRAALAEAALGLGRCEHRRGKPTAALAWFLQALTATPQAVAAGLAVGDALRELARFDEAAEQYGNVLSNAPENSGALVGLGFCERMRGDRVAALGWFRRAGAGTPERRVGMEALEEWCSRVWPHV